MGTVLVWLWGWQVEGDWEKKDSFAVDVDVDVDEVDVDVVEEDEDEEGEGEAPNNFANTASLYTHIPMFTLVVAKNLAVPGKTAAKGLSRNVDIIVSIVFAVRYVPV